MKQQLTSGLMAIVALFVFLVYNAAYVVFQTQQAILLQFGEARKVDTEPGLYFKIPFVQNVVYIDKRILDLDSQTQEVIAADQKRLVVDAFARYRITDSLKFVQSIGSLEGANSRLASIMNSAVRRVLGEVTFQAVVRDNRAALMAKIRDQVNNEAKNFGIAVVDVRIRRADLPDANSQAVFQRMQTERQREAAEIRAQGQEQALRIRSKADRDVTVLLAEATRDAERMRGEGDAERNRVFADAFGKDSSFFSFYRSMQAYEAGLKGTETRLLLSPDSDFFRYFTSPQGRAVTRQ